MVLVPLKPYSCYDLIVFAVFFYVLYSLVGFDTLFFLFLLLLREVGIGGFTDSVWCCDFFWLIGDWSPYFVLDSPFFFDFDFLLTDFPCCLLLLSFLWRWESLIILNFCLIELCSFIYWELFIFGFDLLSWLCKEGLTEWRLASVSLTELL